MSWHKTFVTRPILNHVYTIKINEYGDYDVVGKRKIPSIERNWNKLFKDGEAENERRE